MMADYWLFSWGLCHQFMVSYFTMYHFQSFNNKVHVAFLYQLAFSLGDIISHGGILMGDIIELLGCNFCFIKLFFFLSFLYVCISFFFFFFFFFFVYVCISMGNFAFI